MANEQNSTLGRTQAELDALQIRHDNAEDRVSHLSGLLDETTMTLAVCQSKNAKLLEALEEMVTGCEMHGIRLLGHDQARAAIEAAS